MKQFSEGVMVGLYPDAVNTYSVARCEYHGTGKDSSILRLFARSFVRDLYKRGMQHDSPEVLFVVRKYAQLSLPTL